jgi:hypothetical protein
MYWLGAGCGAMIAGGVAIGRGIILLITPQNLINYR